MLTAKRLIECVPNFSEGRDPIVLDAIRSAIIEKGDCELWDYSADVDHNRSVFTFAGEPEAVGNAAFRAVQIAASLINMEKHEGVHPCIGAADVVPFVPLKNVSMDDCSELAILTGEKIADKLQLPVYLYANAAIISEHKRLADIRRGGYLKLKDEINTVANRKPDLGPALMRQAGGVSIGARDFLIAFNIYLKTSETELARDIARKIRESSGGFTAVQAIGLQVNGLAQVSMNLLDFRKTPLITVFKAVQDEAIKLGTAPFYSELIGMLPRDALTGFDPEELLLRDFDENRILEEHYR